MCPSLRGKQFRDSPVLLVVLRRRSWPRSKRYGFHTTSPALLAGRQSLVDPSRFNNGASVIACRTETQADLCGILSRCRLTTKAYSLQKTVESLTIRLIYASNVTSTRLRRQLHEGGQLFTDRYSNVISSISSHLLLYVFVVSTLNLA